MVGPDWTGNLPPGITAVVRSSTNSVFAVARVFMDDTPDDHTAFHPNPPNRYSLGTKNKNLKYNVDGSLTIYAGAKSPGADKKSNWLPAPDGAFSLYIRAYWADKAIIDGSWTPPAIARFEGGSRALQ